MDKRPSKFFKYRSMDASSVQWVERTVLHNEVFFAPALSLNDPFDLRPAFDLEATPEEHLRRHLASSMKFEPHLSASEREAAAKQAMTAMTPERINDTASVIQALYSEVLSTTHGVFCVSEKNDDILMWSHYADDHRGICLEFDGEGKFMAHANPVRYSEDRVPINPYKDDADTMLEKAMLVKSCHWAYEAEWRLLSYQRGPGIVQFRPENLIGIVIGAMAISSTIEKVLGWCKARHWPIKVYRASVSQKKFELDILP